VIIFIEKTRKSIALNNRSLRIIFSVIIIILLSQNFVIAISEENEKITSNIKFDGDRLVDDINFLCFVNIRMSECGYGYTFPFILSLFLSYTEFQERFPEFGELIHIIQEISLEIGNCNPIVFPHFITHIEGKGCIDTFGLLGHGEDNSGGYGVITFHLIGFRGIKYKLKDSGLNMIGWAYCCIY